MRSPWSESKRRLSSRRPWRRKRVRCLLDENMARSLAPALTERGHPTFHVIDLGLASSPDENLLELAADFDLFITFDRLLQPPEWHAAREAMLRVCGSFDCERQRASAPTPPHSYACCGAAGR